MSSRISRRRFMHGLATVGGAMFVGPYILRAAEVNKNKVRIAFVGTGGRAHSHVTGMTKNTICPCYCDVNKSAYKAIAGIAPSAASYTDYRKMFDKHMKEIDAVVVAVPDHNHAAPSMIAVSNGKHCYTEKPLTWSIGEARALAEAATKYKVATQMGNQGHANEGNRRVVEWVRGGVIGDIVEVHTWTNRPIWPQGIEQRPATAPVPADLDWDSWLGPAPFREYHDGLHPFKWRGWFDFGCGAIGDMGCHTWDCAFWALAPDYPTTVELVRIEGRTKETWPKQSVVRWNYPAKGNRPAFVAYWYEGGLKPPVPEEMKNDPFYQSGGGGAAKPKKGKGKEKDAPAAGGKKEVALPGSGSLFIGTKGKLFVAGDYGDSPRLIPESFHQEAKRPDKSIPKSPGHAEEWLLACAGEKPIDFPGSNWPGYAGPLTENMLLGSLVIKLGEVGGKVECDPVKREVLTAEGKALLLRQYRQGWTL